MVVRLMLIAQAETDSARAGAFADDEGLSERGRSAAAALRPRVPSADVAFVAPGRAAHETASELGLAPAPEAALRDLDVGDWSGRTLVEIAAADEAAAGAFLTDPTFAGYGGESLDAFVARIGLWLQAGRARRGTTIAVASAAVLRAATVALLGAPVPAFWQVDVAALDALTLGSDGHRWTLRRLAPLG